MEEGVQHFGEKWLAVNIDCHCWESKRERNERKQVHLPQVYNPEITVCSGACLTALQAARASLLISSAPAVQELIWRFSESITLLSKVSLPERYTHTCTHAHIKKQMQWNTRTHIWNTFLPLQYTFIHRGKLHNLWHTSHELDLVPFCYTLYSWVGVY